MSDINMSVDVTEIQLVREIDRVEQSRNRRLAARHIFSVCLSFAVCTALVLTLWFPVFSTNQGQIVLGMRTDYLKKGELAVINRENGISLCRIIAVSGEQTDLSISFLNQVPADCFLIEMVVQDAQNFHLVRKEEIVARVICSVWPLQLPESIK